MVSMYVELVPDNEQSPQKFQIVQAPTYLLLETNYQLGDYIPASDIDLIVNHAVNLGYQVKICPVPKQNVQYLLPAISKELHDLMIDYPSDLKLRTNGMVFEQCAYLMAKVFHEVCQNIESNKLIKEAEYWLVNYAREVITKECDYLPEILTKLDQPTVRSMAIDALMVWQPNWEKAISQHAGSKFEAGNNEFEIISHYQDYSKKGREGTMVLCKVTKIMDKYPDFPIFPLHEICTLGTYQVENALNQRLA